MLRCYVTWWVFLRIRQTGDNHKSKTQIKQTFASCNYEICNICQTHIWYQSFVNIMELYLFIKQPRRHYIKFKVKFRVVEDWGNIFFCQNKSCLFSRLLCLAVAQCLYLSGDEKGGWSHTECFTEYRPGRLPKPQKRQRCMPPLYFYIINHILSKCIYK